MHPSMHDDLRDANAPVCTEQGSSSSASRDWRPYDFDRFRAGLAPRVFAEQFAGRRGCAIAATRLDNTWVAPYGLRTARTVAPLSAGLVRSLPRRLAVQPGADLVAAVGVTRELVEAARSRSSSPVTSWHLSAVEGSAAARGPRGGDRRYCTLKPGAAHRSNGGWRWTG
jgi:hypothetical protein